MSSTAPYPLDALHVAIAAAFVLIAGLVSLVFRLRLGKRLLISSLRATAQLTLAGLALTTVFGIRNLALVALLAAVMIALAGREALRRQRVKVTGVAFDVFLSMVVSALSVSVLVTGIIIRAEPVWTPPVFVPILGMILGNSLNGISLGLDRFLNGCVEQRAMIETRLALGATPNEAVQPLVRDAVRTGMIPIINAMAIVGIVSLPGMMTGQILAGSPPMEAAKYQLLIMFLIAGGTGLGSVAAVSIGARRLFDGRHRLRLERLRVARG